MGNRVLIAGALGICGRNAVRHFADVGGWDIVGLSRRSPDYESPARYVSVDLRDPRDCHEKLSELGDFSHIVYTANFEKPSGVVSAWTEQEHVDTNFAMLRNLLDAALPRSRSLERLILLQGTKAYGSAVGPIKIPGKEDDPRSLAPNFYYPQEDYVRELQQGKRWTWTVLRPQFICGHALSSSLNGLTPVGVYAAISRELNMPLRFPGGEPRVTEATDARLLAKAIRWAATTPRCGNEIFNIVNGDCFTWPALWPKIARLFQMEVGHIAPCSLVTVMADKGPVWDRIVAKHNLKPYKLEQLVPTWQFTNRLFGYGSRPGYTSISGIKSRKFGFLEFQDSEEMWLDWLRILQQDRILPTYS